MREVHRALAEWLEPLGTRISVDAVGNFRAVYAGQTADAPRLLIGSHLDTVPNAGAFDGILGVMLAVALIEGLNGRRLPYAIEIVGFSEEEGVRFRVPFIGSRALVGAIDEELLETQDPQGITVRRAIKEFGLNPSEISQARVSQNACGYLEFHIEQGPVLEKLNSPLAVVEAIAGQSRLDVQFVGRSNHAGTTPMELRFDAMAGAAEWIVAVEQAAKKVEGMVATVGSVQTKPGAGNVIAGEAELTLDVRHSDDNVRTSAVKGFMEEADEIAQERGLSVSWVGRLNQPSVPMSPFLIHEVEKAMVKTRCRAHRMVSGAGHDAMVLAEEIPSAMIFLRTPGGISHDPAESVLAGDVAQAIECGLHLLDQLASTDSFLKGTWRA